MPTPADRHRNNIRMGIFVSISIVLGMGVVIALTDALSYFSGATERYTVRFTVQSGVNNLKPGSEVRVGGMRLGEVVAIEPRFDGDDVEPFRFIDVHFKLDRNVRLYQNARILVSAPLIGAEAWLDIPYVGEGAPAADLLDGAERIGMLSALLGDDAASQARQMIDNSQQFTEFLASLRDEYDASVAPALADFRATTSDARELMHTIRHENWPAWSGSVDDLLVWAALSTDNLDELLAEGRGLFTDSRGVIAENQDELRETITDLRAASADWRSAAQRINTQIVEQLHGLLLTGQEGLDEARDAMQTFRTDYDGWAVSIGEAMGRANLASQQLNLTMTEVRRSPWKVLYRPSQRELEHELLYEAARSFAVAAADLKAASQSVQRVLDRHGDQIAVDEAARDRITRSLMDPLEQYELAQQRLLDVLFADR